MELGFVRSILEDRSEVDNFVVSDSCEASYQAGSMTSFFEVWPAYVHVQDEARRHNTFRVFKLQVSELTTDYALVCPLFRPRVGTRIRHFCFGFSGF